MPVQSISPLDPKQWGGYAHKASPKGVVRFAVGPAGLKPCTTSRLPNWLGRFSVDYMKGQSRQYLTLINAIEQTTSADPSIATDVDVQTAQAELVEQIRSKAELAKSLHWQEITPLLIRWQAALQAAEIKKAAQVGQRHALALKQLNESGPFQGDEQDLAKALLLPGQQPPPQPAAKGRPAQLVSGAFEVLFNALCGPAESCSRVGLTPEQQAELKKSDEAQRARTVLQSTSALSSLLAADLQEPLSLFDKLGQDVAGLLRLESDCIAYFRAIQEGKQPTRRQTEAMRTVASLGSFGSMKEGKSKFGKAYVPPGVKNPDKLPWNIRQGLGGLSALHQVNQYLTRCGMEMHALEDLAREPIPQDADEREQRVKEFRARCGYLQHAVQTSLRRMRRLSQTLARLDFKGLPPNQALILRRCGDHFEAMLLYLAGTEFPGSTAPNPYKAAYQLAALGKDEPEAALDLLRGALQHADGNTQPPVRSDSPKPPVSPAQDIQDIQDVQDQTREELDQLIEGLDQLAHAKDGHDRSRPPSQNLDQLMHELEHWDDGKPDADRRRPTSATVDEHLSEIGKLYRSEVGEPVDIPDPAAHLNHQPASPTRHEQRPVPAFGSLRREAQKQISVHTDRLRAQADYLTKLPNELSNKPIDTAAAMRFHRALAKAPLPADWGISVPSQTKPSLLPHDLKLGAAATYALTQGPDLLAKLDEQAQALVQMQELAQEPGADGANTVQLASARTGYRKAYETTVHWFESRAQHLLSAPFLQAFSEEDRRSLKQYGEALATMARSLRHPGSAEALLFASTQPQEAAQPAQRSRQLKRERSGRRQAKAMRIRKISVDDNPRKKITRETSAELKPHLKELRRQTWASTATASGLGTDPDGNSADEMLKQTLAELDSTLPLSPRSLTQAQRVHDRESVNLAQPERIHTDTGSDLSTFDEVDKFLAQLESSSLTLYDDEHNTLPMPAVPERPPYEKPGTRPARAGGT